MYQSGGKPPYSKSPRHDCDLLLIRELDHFIPIKHQRLSRGDA
jgi:hypothetical protein